MRCIRLLVRTRIARADRHRPATPTRPAARRAAATRSSEVAEPGGGPPRRAAAGSPARLGGGRAGGGPSGEGSGGFRRGVTERLEGRRSLVVGQEAGRLPLSAA